MEGVQLEVDRFKCYLTRVRLIHSEGSDSTCLEDQLLDASDPSSWKLSHADSIGLRPGELRFLIGVDSTVQVGQTQGGVLDPIRGMYWTWQAGYIHWKIEGHYLSGGKSRFEYHIGGYRKPYGTAQLVHIPFAPENEELSVDLAPFLSHMLKMDIPARVMSPGPLAHDLASFIPNCLGKTKR